ncbi:hypothetical protein [Loktanella sp. SALINAS62]|nr:hypothetical protein [Loktanella sp. SALINAS62]
MIPKLLVLAALCAVAACTPARIVGNTAIGAGQLTLAAADVVI